MKKIFLFLITVFVAYLTAYQTTGKKHGYPSPFDFSWIDSLNLSADTPKPAPEDFPAYALINDDMYMGYEQFLKENYNDAIDHFYDAVYDPATEAKAHLMIGRSYMKLNQTEDAKYYLNVAAEKDPKDPEIYFYRGKLYYNLGTYKKAVSDLYLASELGFENPEALYLLSLSYENEQNTEASLQAALEALQKDSTYYDAMFQAGRMYYSTEKYAEAVEIYTRAIEQKPSDKYSLLNRALAYDKLGIKDSALRGYEQVTEIDPQYALVYNNRGWFYHQSDDFDSALQDYNKAIEINPDYELPLWNRASLYLENNNPEQALSDYLKLYELNQNNYMALYNAGLCYEQTNAKENAIEYFEAFINSGSKNYELLDKARAKINKYR